MAKEPTSVVIGLILTLPGIYLFWYANGHPDFYNEKRWEKWHGRAYLLGMLFNLVCRYGGINSVKLSFRLFALICVGTGIWAMFAI